MLILRTDARFLHLQRLAIPCDAVQLLEVARREITVVFCSRFSLAYAAPHEIIAATDHGVETDERNGLQSNISDSLSRLREQFRVNRKQPSKLGRLFSLRRGISSSSVCTRTGELCRYGFPNQSEPEYKTGSGYNLPEQR